MALVLLKRDEATSGVIDIYCKAGCHVLGQGHSFVGAFIARAFVRVVRRVRCETSYQLIANMADGT